MSTAQSGLKNIFFAHSAGPQYGKGKGSYDLVKYLKTKLNGGFKIHFPTIKKPNAPTYDKFKKMFRLELDKVTGPVILIGHSLGGSTLLKYLSEEKPTSTIAGLFLVATPRWGSDMKEFQLKENFQTFLPQIPSVFLYHSKNDKDVPVGHLEFYATAFPGATVRRLPGKEHIFSNGLPRLVSDIKSIV